MGRPARHLCLGALLDSHTCNHRDCRASRCLPLRRARPTLNPEHWQNFGGRLRASLFAFWSTLPWSLPLLLHIRKIDASRAAGAIMNVNASGSFRLTARDVGLLLVVQLYNSSYHLAFQGDVANRNGAAVVELLRIVAKAVYGVRDSSSAPFVSLTIHARTGGRQAGILFGPQSPCLGHVWDQCRRRPSAAAERKAATGCIRAGSCPAKASGLARRRGHRSLSQHDAQYGLWILRLCTRLQGFAEVKHLTMTKNDDVSDDAFSKAARLSAPRSPCTPEPGSVESRRLGSTCAAAPSRSIG